MCFQLFLLVMLNCIILVFGDSLADLPLGNEEIFWSSLPEMSDGNVDSDIPVKTFGRECRPRSIIAINMNNWQQLIYGEWLVLLCSQVDPDCTNLRRILQRMPDSTSDVGLAFGDLSEGTTLRRRMSAIDPITIYHVLDGVFRRLESRQSVFSLRDMVQMRLWTSIRPVLFWKHPTSKWTNFCIFFYKTAMRLLKSGYVGNNYNVAIWSISFVASGILTTGVWIIYVIWCKIPSIWAYYRRRQSPRLDSSPGAIPDAPPAALSAKLSASDSESSSDND